jgi:hypothetical protein
VKREKEEFEVGSVWEHAWEGVSSPEFSRVFVVIGDPYWEAEYDSWTVPVFKIISTLHEADVGPCSFNSSGAMWHDATRLA